MDNVNTIFLVNELQFMSYFLIYKMNNTKIKSIEQNSAETDKNEHVNLVKNGNA